MEGFIVIAPAESETEVLPKGLYWVVYFHNGILSQNYLSAISLSGYPGENYWYKCRKIISDFDNVFVALEYNPFLKKIRNASKYEIKIKLFLIDD